MEDTLRSSRGTQTKCWTAPTAPYITGEEKHHIEVFLKNSLKAPCCYYRTVTSGLQGPDDQRKFSAPFFRPCIFLIVHLQKFPRSVHSRPRMRPYSSARPTRTTFASPLSDMRNSGRTSLSDNKGVRCRPLAATLPYRPNQLRFGGVDSRFCLEGKVDWTHF